MDTLKDKKIKFFEETETSIAHFTANGDECDALYRIRKNVGRRMAAAWNACEGIETTMLEALPLNFKEHAIECDNLREENAALRAAVAEMAKMLPFLTWTESETIGHSDGAEYTKEFVSTLNTYRQTLEIALAKRNEQ